MKFYGCHPEELTDKQLLYLMEMIAVYDIMNEPKDK